jgi:hypothetical protein
MRYRYQYADEEDKQSLIDAHADKYLIEQQNITEGDFLVFSDEPLVYRPPLSEMVETLEGEAAMLALELVDTQIRLDQSETDHANLLFELVDKGVL